MQRQPRAELNGSAGQLEAMLYRLAAIRVAHRQVLTPFLAAALQDLPSTFRFHAGAEAVLVLPLLLTWLIRALRHSRKKSIARR